MAITTTKADDIALEIEEAVLSGEARTPLRG
jgi:hypothetical protein